MVRPRLSQFVLQSRNRQLLFHEILSLCKLPVVEVHIALRRRDVCVAQPAPAMPDILFNKSGSGAPLAWTRCPDYGSGDGGLLEEEDTRDGGIERGQPD
jgi:hypothetical protein